MSGAASTPPATDDGATRSQWLTRDAAARLAIHNHLPLAECAHFGQHRTAQALYDAVVTCYSSLATAALGRLLLPYLFPELFAFATVEDLVSHLRTSNARYRATLPAEFLAKNPPPMGVPPPPLPPSYAAADAVDIIGAEDVGAASASGKCRSSKGKGGRGGGGGSEGGGGSSSGGGGGGGGGGSGGSGGGSGGSSGGGEGSGGSGSGGSGGGRTGAERGGSRGAQRQRQQCRSETSSPQHLCEWKPHTQQRCFSRLDDAWRAEFGDEVERPHWSELLRSGVAIFDLDYDGILSAMYALSASAEGDSYLCEPPDPCIEVAALGASESSLPGNAPAEASHTFTLDSGASRCFFRDSTTLTPLPAPVPIRLADPSGGPDVARSSTVLPCLVVLSGSLSGLHLPSFSTNLRVSICTCTQTGRYLATFTRRPGSSLYRLATEPPQVAASAQVSASRPVAPPCSCRTRLFCGTTASVTPPYHAFVACTPISLSLVFPGLCLPSRPRLPRPAFLASRGSSASLLTPPRFPRRQLPCRLSTWTFRLHLRERFRQDLPVLRLHSDKGGEFSSDLLRDFCRGEGILQPFTLPDSSQQNGFAERHIGLVMEPRGTASSGGPAGALPSLSPRPETLSPQQLREWLVRRARLRSGATGAGGTGVAGAGGAGVTIGAGGTGGTAAAGPGGARTRGAGAVGAGAGGTGTGGAGAGGVGAVDPGAGDARGTTEPGAAGVGGAGAVGAGGGGTDTGGASARGTGAGGAGAGGAETDDPGQVLGVPSSAGLPPLVPGTHAMALRPSSVPLRVPKLPPPESSLPEVPNPESDRARASSPFVSCLLTTVVTDPSFESTTASALVAELVDFAAACRLDYATTLVAESESASPLSIRGECAFGTNVLEDRQEDFACLAAALPHFASMLLAPEGDPDAPDIPTPRSYAEAITGPYSSQWQAAMDAEMASWKSTGTYADEGVDFFQTFSPTPKMTNLRMLLHVAAQRDYELPSLDRAVCTRRSGCAAHLVSPSHFLQVPSGASAGQSKVLARHLASGTTHKGRRLRLLGLPLLLLIRAVLQRFGFQLSSPQPTPLSTSHSLSAPPLDESVEPSGPYPELVGCLMYLMTCTRPDLAYPLILLARYVAPGRHQKVHWDVAKRVLRYLCSTSGMGLMLGGRGPIVLTGNADASWVDDSATQRSSQGYTFILGSGFVSWRSTHSSSVHSSSCEAEIYAGAMAAQELCWLTYLLTDLGEQPRSPPILYVDNKAMIALCQEHRLEHRTKHIALRYFLARELQQRGQLRLAYVATRANTADIFTKALPPGDHQRFSTVLGLLALLFFAGLVTTCSPPLCLWGCVRIL
ncbi:unnamed protein product [Closterium sp. NIES-53]